MERIACLVLISAVVSASGADISSPLSSISSSSSSVSRVNRFLVQCVDLSLKCRGLNCVGQHEERISLEELQVTITITWWCHWWMLFAESGVWWGWWLLLWTHRYAVSERQVWLSTLHCIQPDLLLLPAHLPVLHSPADPDTGAGGHWDQVHGAQWQEVWWLLLLLQVITWLHLPTPGPHLTLLCPACWSWGTSSGIRSILHRSGCAWCSDWVPRCGSRGHLHCHNIQELCLWKGEKSEYKYLIVLK